MSTTGIQKIVCKVAANPAGALRTIVAVAPVVANVAVAAAPVAIVGALGYGAYRLVKSVKEDPNALGEAPQTTASQNA